MWVVIKIESYVDPSKPVESQTPRLTALLPILPHAVYMGF